MARFRPDHAAALYMGSFYPGQQSVLFITGQPRTFFRLHVQQYRTKRTATDHCLHQLSLWHHYHDLSVCRYQYPVDVRLVPLCPKGNSADPVEHTERYRSVLSAGSFAAHYITLGITSLYLSLAIKVVFVASLYALVLWKMQSVIFNECIQFIKKKKIS